MRFYKRYQGSLRFATFWILLAIAILAIVTTFTAEVYKDYVVEDGEKKKGYNFINPWHIQDFIINQKRSSINASRTSPVSLPRLSDTCHKKESGRAFVIIDHTGSIKDKSDKETQTIKLTLQTELNRFGIKHKNKQDTAVVDLLGVWVGAIKSELLVEDKGGKHKNLVAFEYIDDERENRTLNRLSSSEDPFYKFGSSCSSCNSERTMFLKLLEDINSELTSNAPDNSDVNCVIIVSDFLSQNDKSANTFDKLNAIVRDYEDNVYFRLLQLESSKNNTSQYEDFSQYISNAFPEKATVRQITNRELLKCIENNEEDISSWLKPITVIHEKEFGRRILYPTEKVKNQYKYDLQFRSSATGILQTKTPVNYSEDVFKRGNAEQEWSRVKSTPINGHYPIEKGYTYKLELRNFGSKQSGLDSYHIELSPKGHTTSYYYDFVFSPLVDDNILTLWMSCLFIIFFSFSYYVAVFSADYLYAIISRKSKVRFFSRPFLLTVLGVVFFALFSFPLLCFIWDLPFGQQLLVLVILVILVLIGQWLFNDDIVHLQRQSDEE